MAPEMDTRDSDALESLEITEGWALVCGRVMEEIERRRDALEQMPSNVVGPGGVSGLQGFISACRMFLGLPAIMRGEVKE